MLLPVALPAARAQSPQALPQDRAEHCYMLVGPATKNERGQVRSTSAILNYSCYRTAAEREQAHPRTTALSRAVTIQSGTPLVTFYSGEYLSGSSYRIDGYAGCGAYYYVNNLGWMTKNTESLIVFDCKPYQRLHSLENLDDLSNHMYLGLGPMNISVNNGNSGYYYTLGNYKDNTGSWETR
jgi:hypothetical protein